MPHAELGTLHLEKLVPLRAQGVAHALHHRDVASFDLQMVQAVGHALLYPAVAGDAGHAKQVDARRIGQHDEGDPVIEHFHHIRIQQDLFFLQGRLNAGYAEHTQHGHAQHHMGKDPHLYPPCLFRPGKGR